MQASTRTRSSGDVADLFLQAKGTVLFLQISFACKFVLPVGATQSNPFKRTCSATLDGLCSCLHIAVLAYLLEPFVKRVCTTRRAYIADPTMASIINAPDLPSEDEEDQDYDPTRYNPLTQSWARVLAVS